MRKVSTLAVTGVLGTGLALTGASAVGTASAAPAAATATASAGTAKAFACKPLRQKTVFTGTKTAWVGIGKIYTSGPGPGKARVSIKAGATAKGSISVSAGGSASAKIKKIIEADFEAKVDVNLEFSASLEATETASFSIPKKKYLKIRYQVKTKQANWKRVTVYDNCRDKVTSRGFTRMIVKPIDGGWHVRRVSRR
ncbi:hypothetical protein ACGFNU_11105 [Spirillospora sp. NPDC048911]|uniref:hypothetical protein n=1 Tax=Spirillospora sp. NPDC048911 TaxID=3364527 RepID=UPI00371D9685